MSDSSPSYEDCANCQANRPIFVFTDHDHSVPRCQKCRFPTQRPLPTADPSTLTPAQRRNIRILTIDDDRLFSGILRETLEDHGYTVLQAFDGRSGLQLPRQERPHLILAEIMPELDGFQVCEQVKKTPGLTGIAVVIFTRLSSHDLNERA